MRSITVAAMMAGLFLQVGCASISTMTVKRKPKSNPEASADYVQAKDWERQGKFERSRELLEQMLDKDPENPEYMHRLGVICTRLQRYGEADNYFERAHKRDPKNASLLVDMGYACYLRNNLDEAERLLKEATHLKPSDKRATKNLALVIGCRGKIEESLALLRQIEDPATALSDLAYIHSQRGELDLAEQRYGEALEIDPKHKDATSGLAELTRRHPHHEAVAETDSKHQDFFALAEVPADTQSPVIQRVSAVAEPAAKAVVNANFEEDAEAEAPDEPAVLQAKHEIATQPARRKTAIAIEEDNDFSEQDIRSSKASARREPMELPQEDWASEIPVTRNKTVTFARKPPAAFDPLTDDEPTSRDTPSAAPASSVDSLKFVPSKSRSGRTVTPKLDAWDSPSTASE